MSLTIWKYPILIDDEQIITPPKGAEILTIQVQDMQPYLWALVDPDRPPDRIKLITKGTGHPIGDKEVGEYVGTYQFGKLVFHVFHPWRPE